MDKHARDDAEDRDTDPPGPVDHDREGGMATREIAPELTEPDR
ncbi:hypothetical protein [Mycolicibacterium iranicum]|nr:hypothetical protein [Mycolicibacterium iranicum]